MKRYLRSHLSDPALLHSATTHAAQERTATAELLADLAEIDIRKLYLPAAYPSLFAWCLGELRLSEDAALTRIRVARAARRFPVILDAVADGRLHLSAVVRVAPHLTEETAGELLGAIMGKSKAEIEQLLAERFPRSDVLTWVEPIAVPAPTPGEPAPAGQGQLVPEPVAGAQVVVPTEATPVTARVMALSFQSFALQVTIGKDTREKLRHAEELLGHRIPSGDIAAVLDRVLDLAIAQLEKQRFAATAKPRPGHRRTAHGSRHIPADVQREVWERDGGQCTYVSEAGRRCEARTPLEFDHALEFARGGEATVEGIRLLCRAHNQHRAERTFGSEFMRHKRIAAAEWRAAARARAEKTECARAAAKARHEEPTHVQEVIPCMRALGYRAGEARDAARRCSDMPDAPLEQRVRVALSYFRLRGTKVGAPEPARGATTQG